MRFLIDSDVLIELERHRATSLLERFIANQGHLAVSSIGVSELFYGVARSRWPQQAEASLEALLTNLSVLNFDRKDAEHAADIRAGLHKAGTPIGTHDILIAAQARARALVLATSNTREFDRVPGLRTENWLTN
ncbi:type II toxin-antitoxin system VapC family toxin [Alpinimonas psychrophila]|uniref:Ribonuclease VapC n=1 Tax=Alpinimonas psychrophila TaxID=748908 RepID=A0A7W3JRU2_9MICO|nr:tRNA(fMet)-specific endonuclease VapC [Alpinimonas psychrophila]